MNCKTPVILLLAFVPALCLGQREDRWLRGGPTQAPQLLEEIFTLQRLVVLELTDAQLDQIIPLYAKLAPADETGQGDTVRQLTEIKQRLLGGTPLVATDLVKLKELSRAVYQKRRTEAPPPPPPARGEEAVGTTPLTPLEAALWQALTPVQQAALLGDVRGPAANNQKADQALSRRAIKLIGQLLKQDDAAWTPARDGLAAALAHEAGPDGTPQRDNSQKMFQEFLDRLRKMPQADFARRQEELAAELLALLPPHTNLLVAMARYNTQMVHSALAISLLSPRGEDLLTQIKAARVRTQAP